jgi:SulP family sulfate permease
MIARLSTGVKASLVYFIRPASILRNYRRADLRPDLIAGLTVGVILLPQAIAYALIAGMPPQLGLYSAVFAAAVGALWGSSSHLHTGPTNTASLLVLTTLLPIAAAGTPEFIVAASVLAVMIGIFRLFLGLARLGLLVNFVSDSVIIGFTAGAGVLIWVSQLSHILRLTIPSSPSMVNTLANVAGQLGTTHWQSLLLGIIALAIIIVLRRVNYKLPGALIALILAATAVWIFNLQEYGLSVIGAVPGGLPPLTDFSKVNLDLIFDLSSGALAIGAIGLVEAMSIARSVASQTGQRLDSNQEFIGQGLANIACGIFSGFAVGGSFSRTAVNQNSGARTSISSVFSALFVLVAALLLGPLTAYVPRAALAGVLFLIAYGMIDWKEIRRILRGAPGDVFIMAATFVATLLLPLQFAVLTGILFSFAVYILRTSVPRLVCVLPDDQFKHLVHRPDKPLCTQLVIFKILGDLYFGAVSNVEKVLHDHLERNRDQRYLLLSMESVNQCDISGIHALESILRKCRDRGGDLFLQRVQDPVWQIMQSTGFSRQLGPDHLLSEDQAISYIYHRILDPAICIYECEVRVFIECQNLPKQIIPLEQMPLHTQIPLSEVKEVTALELWKQLRSAEPPLVIDVREPREFSQGHISQAKLIPLYQLLTARLDLPGDQEIVLVCQGGRRSSRACYALSNQGYPVRVLQGGMLAWENAGLIEAVD